MQFARLLAAAVSAPPATGWQVDTTGANADAPVSGSVFSFPSLTPANSNEAYVGLNFWSYGTNSGGSTSGYTYGNPGGATTNYYCYNTSISSVTTPTAANNNNGSDNCGVIAALFFYPAKTISEVGVASGDGSGFASLSITTHTIGNLVVVMISMGAETAVTGVTCSLVSGGFAKAVAAQTATNGGQDGEIWYGVVTSTGTANVVVSPTSGGFASITEIELAHS
jgi:hypothetical protein